MNSIDAIGTKLPNNCDFDFGSYGMWSPRVVSVPSSALPKSSTLQLMWATFRQIVRTVSAYDLAPSWR